MTTVEDDRPKKKKNISKSSLKSSGIGRVDNNMKNTLFSSVTPINQKNYYTDYLKRDHQIMALRELAEKEKLEKDKKSTETAVKTGEDETGSPAADEVFGSKTVVIHPGSATLRIGLASQAYPKSIPYAIAHKVKPGNEEDTSMEDEGNFTKSQEDFTNAYDVVYKDFRERMKFYKRRILPNAHDLVVGFNSKSQPENIPDHNDPARIEWTDIEEAQKPEFFTGEDALLIPFDSKPHYSLRWPMRFGLLNEEDYTTAQEVLGDISIIITQALSKHLGIKSLHEYPQYNVVLVIPDLYDKTYVSSMIEMILNLGFANISIIQESVAATFGAGISTACVVDIGAGKTSVTCVEDGMCVSDSRVNLRYGGDDVTIALIRLLERSHFPYTPELRLMHDWLLADELKRKFATLNDAEINVHLDNFYQRTPGKTTRKYQFKVFDEIMLAPLGLFYPELFEMDDKLKDRYRLFPRSLDMFDKKEKTNDPISDAQINICKNTLAVWGMSYVDDTNLQPPPGGTNTGTPGSPSGTPVPQAAPVGESAQARAAAHNAYVASQLLVQQEAADSLNPREVAQIGLDHAIIESITQAALKSTLSDQQAFYENLLIVGGGGKFQGFENVLIDRLHMWREGAARQVKRAAPEGEIQIMPAPRDMDPELITWKGGSVFAKLKIVNEVWISQKDWDMLGSRCLQYKALFSY